eukprot:14276791-Ditylum_brightwellii.AAC.1
MKKDNNIEAIQQELQARGLGDKFDGNTKWKILLVLLKENEGNEKYFKPVARYEHFKWNCSHFMEDC